MTAGQPVSRVFARRGYLEVNRVCAIDIAPHPWFITPARCSTAMRAGKLSSAATIEWSATLSPARTEPYFAQLASVRSHTRGAGPGTAARGRTPASPAPNQKSAGNAGMTMPG
jgi:hypothetical protein